MTRQEAGQVMDILSAAYPQFYSKQEPDELINALNLWAAMFADDEVAVVAAAIKALIAGDQKGFPPVIGQVKDYIRRITAPELMGEAEAWGYVMRALRNSAYNSVREFERLPEIIQRLVGTPAQLREWAMVDIDDLQTVVQSNFMRSYRGRAQSEREYLALPADVKDMMAGLADGLRMDRLTAGKGE